MEINLSLSLTSLEHRLLCSFSGGQERRPLRIQGTKHHLALKREGRIQAGHHEEFSGTSEVQHLELQSLGLWYVVGDQRAPGHPSVSLGPLWCCCCPLLAGVW